MFRTTFVLLSALLLYRCTPLQAQTSSDIAFPPTTSAGHDLNHSPVGQTFRAVAGQVTAGIYLASQDAFTNWLATVYPGQIVPGSYPYPIAPTVTVTVSLLEGEGFSGILLHSATKTFSAPFSGFADVDYAGAGITLTVGATYTLVVEHLDPGSNPNGVTGWVVPSVTNNTPGTGQPIVDSNGNITGYLPFGAYADGNPILQGALYANDAGIGDNSFHVLDVSGVTPECFGTKAVVTSVGRNFIVVNGGLNAADHVFYTPTPAGTTFLGGTSTFVTGELVTYVGTLDGIGACNATAMTVEPAAVVPTATPTAIPTATPTNTPLPTATPTPVPTATATPLTDCSAPNRGKEREGRGRVVSVAPDSIVVGRDTIKVNSCTKVRGDDPRTGLRVGSRIAWKGFSAAGVVTASSLELE